MGQDFPSEDLTCSKCDRLMHISIRLGEFHHWTDCDAGVEECQLIRDMVEANDGQSIDVSVTNPE